MNKFIYYSMCSQLKSLFLMGIFFIAPSLFAMQDRDDNPFGGLQVSVQLGHRVVIPQILFFRVGSSVSVERVTFDLSDQQAIGNSSYNSSSSLVLGNGNAIPAQSNGTLNVFLSSNVTPVEISYTVSNTNGLSDGNGNFIAFDEIQTTSNLAQLPPPVLSNTGGGAGSANAVTINGNNFGGLVADYQAQWTFEYRNSSLPIAGTYTGRITYTVSAP